MNHIHVVFGTQRLAMQYIWLYGVVAENVILATDPDNLDGHKGSVTTVRYSEEVWQPPTLPCEKRVRETEEAIRRLKKAGSEVKNLEIR